MELNEIFAKDVQRPIEGVIKADDAAHLGTEVEEYVLTNEAAKGLELLLEAILVGRTGVVIRIEIGTAPQSCQEHTEQHQSGSTQKEAS